MGHDKGGFNQQGEASFFIDLTLVCNQLSYNGRLAAYAPFLSNQA